MYTHPDYKLPTSTRFRPGHPCSNVMAVTAGKPMRSEDLAFSVNTNAHLYPLVAFPPAGGRIVRLSQLGVGGGALLAKPPEEIRLLEVYRAVENGEVFALSSPGPQRGLCL